MSCWAFTTRPLFGKVNSVDDFKMLTHLQNTTHFGLKEMFWPGGGFYYRPFLRLTLWIDKVLWGLEPSFMHLENVLIHALNTVLVMLLAQKVFSAMELKRPELPLLSALIFALHPINTESINWISGRTDPLATIFILTAVLVLVIGLERQSKLLVFGASLIFCGGVLSKEMMVFFWPAGLFLDLALAIGPGWQGAVEADSAFCLSLTDSGSDLRCRPAGCSPPPCNKPR